MTLHNECMRANMKKLRGYEISFTKDNCFLAAFATLDEALEWTTSIQQQLLTLDWPIELSKCIQYVNAGLFKSKLVINYVINRAAVEVSDAGKTFWRGLRVRMGINKGMPKLEREEYSDKISYVCCKKKQD